MSGGAAKRSGLPGPGARMGPYEIEALIGKGGMGAVYRARHTMSGARHALKVVLASRLARDDGGRAVARFRREVEVLARIDDHPNVVRVHSCGVDGGLPWCAMELVEGVSLAERLDAAGPLGARDAARLAATLGRALQHTHEQGVVHRDLKPENVLIGPDGAPHLVDFGLARDAFADQLTRTGEMLGTPAFMAPEQVRSGPEVGPQTDVYGLGAVLYAALSGHAPFEGGSAVELLTAIVNGRSTPLREHVKDAPADLVAICRRAMAVAVDDRYASCGALADDIDRWLGGEPTDALTSSAGSRGISSAARRLGRSRLARPIAAAALVAALAVGFELTREALRPSPARRATDLWKALLAGGELDRTGRADLAELAADAGVGRDAGLARRVRALSLTVDLAAGQRGERAVELARALRADGALDRRLLLDATEALRRAGRLDAVAAIHFGAEPQALPDPGLAAELVRAALAAPAGEEVALPDEAGLTQLLRAGGLDDTERGRLLVRAAGRDIAAGAHERALERLVRAIDEHAVPPPPADGWTEAFVAFCWSRLAAELAAHEPEAARLLAAVLVRSGAAERRLDPVTVAALQNAAGIATVLGEGLDLPTEKHVARVLAAGGVLEAAGVWTVHYDLMKAIAGGQMGVERLRRLGEEEASLPLGRRDPARLLFCAWMLDAAGRKDLAPPLLDAASEVGLSAWLEALAGVMYFRLERNDEAMKRVEHAWEVEQRRPPELRRAYIPERIASALLDFEDRPVITAEETLRAGRLILEAARYQEAAYPRLEAISAQGGMAPWAISREQGCAETMAAAIERIVALGPPRCCDERAPPLDEMAERGLELAARPMAKIGAAVEYRLGEVPPSTRIATALASHEIAHGRAGRALDHLAGGIARELENPPLSEQERPRQWTRIAQMHEGRAGLLLRLGRREEAAEAARQGRDYRQRAGR